MIRALKIFSVLALLVVSVEGVSAQKKESRKDGRQRVEEPETSENVSATVEDKVSVKDSLLTRKSLLLERLKSLDSPVIEMPYINNFIEALVIPYGTAAQEHMDFCRIAIADLKGISSQTDSVLLRLETYIDAESAVTVAEQVLNSPFDPVRINEVESQLEVLSKRPATPEVVDSINKMLSGLKYYKNKLVLRRVKDIIEELNELRESYGMEELNESSQVDIDKTFDEIVNHQGRNRLIGYVPYVWGLCEQIIGAFKIDNNRVVLPETDWDKIEQIEKEVDDTLKLK